MFGLKSWLWVGFGDPKKAPPNVEWPWATDLSACQNDGSSFQIQRKPTIFWGGRSQFGGLAFTDIQQVPTNDGSVLRRHSEHVGPAFAWQGSVEV